MNGAFDRFWKTGIQLNMHMNGDAAAEQALKAVERSEKADGKHDSRPVFIHATYMRPDQIARMKEVGAVPTFTVGSLPLGGEAAIHYWGEQRAAASMPMNTLEKLGIKFSLQPRCADPAAARRAGPRRRGGEPHHGLGPGGGTR